MSKLVRYSVLESPYNALGYGQNQIITHQIDSSSIMDLSEAVLWCRITPTTANGSFYNVSFGNVRFDNNYFFNNSKIKFGKVGYVDEALYSNIREMNLNNYKYNYEQRNSIGNFGVMGSSINGAAIPGSPLLVNYDTGTYLSADIPIYLRDIHPILRKMRSVPMDKLGQLTLTNELNIDGITKFIQEPAVTIPKQEPATFADIDATGKVLTTTADMSATLFPYYNANGPTGTKVVINATNMTNSPLTTYIVSYGNSGAKATITLLDDMVKGANDITNITMTVVDPDIFLVAPLANANTQTLTSYFEYTQAELDSLKLLPNIGMQVYGGVNIPTNIKATVSVANAALNAQNKIVFTLKQQFNPGATSRPHLKLEPATNNNFVIAVDHIYLTIPELILAPTQRDALLNKFNGNGKIQFNSWTVQPVQMYAGNAFQHVFTLERDTKACFLMLPNGGLLSDATGLISYRNAINNIDTTEMDVKYNSSMYYHKLIKTFAHCGTNCNAFPFDPTQNAGTGQIPIIAERVKPAENNKLLVRLTGNNMPAQTIYLFEYREREMTNTKGYITIE